tara:strand:+ start:76 stop:201 length:126 start_codon:yes stop_codon:yes gene_type:complete
LELEVQLHQMLVEEAIQFIQGQPQLHQQVVEVVVKMVQQTH